MIFCSIPLVQLLFACNSWRFACGKTEIIFIEACVKPMTAPINIPVVYVIDGYASLYGLSSIPKTTWDSLPNHQESTLLLIHQNNTQWSYLRTNDQEHQKNFRSQAQRLKHPRTRKIPWKMTKTKRSLLNFFLTKQKSSFTKSYMEETYTLQYQSNAFTQLAQKQRMLM